MFTPGLTIAHQQGVEDVVANRGDASIGSVTEFEHLKPQEEAIGEIIHSYLGLTTVVYIII